MKKWIFLLALPLCSMKKSDLDPITWSYSVKQIDKGVLEVHIIAHLAEGWHIYAMQQPGKIRSIPTSIHFSGSDNSLFQLVGDVQELGKLIPSQDNATGKVIVQNVIERSVEYVQRVKTRYAVTSSVSGFIKYQVCNESSCMRPTDQPFTIALQSTVNTLIR